MMRMTNLCCPAGFPREPSRHSSAAIMERGSEPCGSPQAPYLGSRPYSGRHALWRSARAGNLGGSPKECRL